MLEVKIATEDAILQHQPVTGVTAAVDVGKLVYRTDDEDLTLTKGTVNTLGGTATGYILKHETSTEVTMYEFGASKFQQSMIEEEVI